jgi:parallel beta-helix repeat protein
MAQKPGFQFAAKNGFHKCFNMKRLSSRCLLAAGLMLLSVASYGQTPINSVPYTITSPGAYLLTKNLSYGPTSGAAITINSPNVILDFGGHFLASTFTQSNNIGVLVSDVRNVTIENGTATGFHYGIFLYNGTQVPAKNAGHVVEKMRLTNSYIGVWLNLGSGCLIQNNYIDAFGLTGTNAGVFVDGGVGNQVIRNQVLNSFYGILATGSNYLESNLMYGCEYGLSMAFSTKYRLNTTIDCHIPFSQGTPLTDNNN